MTDAPRIGLAEFAVRLSVRRGRGDWVVLVAPAGQVREVSEGLLLELVAVGESKIAEIRQPHGAIDLVRRVSQARAELVICSGLEDFGTEDWILLDARRSQLQDLPLVALVLSSERLSALLEFSPHLAGWLTSSISFLDPNFEGLTEAERAERLSRLRMEMGLTDTEVVERAASGSLERDPFSPNDSFCWDGETCLPIEAARISAREVEASVSTINPELPASPRLLRAQIHTSLINASDEGLLLSAPHEVFRLLNISTTPDHIFATLSCGESFDKGQEGGRFLYRADGARLSFSITVCA